MSQINYNPKAVKSITAWEPVCVSVCDSTAHMSWRENCRDETKYACQPRQRHAGVCVCKKPGRYDSREVRSGVYFDNQMEAFAWMRDNMIPEYAAKVAAGVRTALAGKTKSGYCEVRAKAGLDPKRNDGDHFWDDYFNYVLSGRVNTRNSYAWKRRQYWWKTVDAFAFRVEKVTLWVPVN